MKFSIILSILIFLFSKTVTAEDKFFKIKLIDGSSNFLQSSVWQGNFLAPNGKKFDFSEYYRPKKTELNLSGIIVFPFNQNSIFTIPFIFDNGYKSDLYIVEERLDLSLNYFEKINQFSQLSFGFNSLFSLGGNIKEHPCVDQFQRDFHCGTGLPWVDYLTIKHQKETKRSLYINYKFLF